MAPLVAPRQFDVFENPSVGSRAYAPFLIVLQSHHLAAIDTVVVAPLITDTDRPLLLIDIPVVVQGQQIFIAMSELANMPKRVLRTAVVNLADQEDDIRRALDRLFTGF
jgi:toxin CcdB